MKERIGEGPSNHGTFWDMTNEKRVVVELAYMREHEAQPEVSDINRLYEVSSEQWRLAWKCGAELMDAPAETWGDLAMQMEVFFEDTGRHGNGRR